MSFTRSSGILLHPSSLSGTPGIGTLGKSAYSFVDWLSEAHQSLWQILPLGPTGYGDSPYASFSTYAGNPLLIDLDLLVEKGRAEAASAIPPDYIEKDGPVNFGAVVWWKNPALKVAADWFLQHGSAEDLSAYEKFKSTHAFWLDNYATFTTIKEQYDALAQKKSVNGIWHTFWPDHLAAFDPRAVSDWNTAHVQEMEIVKTIQFFFFDQWHALKKYANGKGISLIGDIPIFVAPDSADVWSNQRLFRLNKHGVPLDVAGVPPDYFSSTGQLWGNPLYDWEAMKEDRYRWWINRLRHVLTLVDYVRVDHFRGFESYWAVPYGEKTAVKGEWRPGPGEDLFAVLKQTLGDVPIIAEDLGLITEAVTDLRMHCGFPGMKVLQFAFNPEEAGKKGMTNAFLPHMFVPDCVVYTGTHDNDTMQGWLESAPPEAVQLAADYVYSAHIPAGQTRASVQSGELCRKLVNAAFASVACFAIIPLQDIFALGSSARMNTPATTGVNWTWRMEPDLLTSRRAVELAYLSVLYGRNLQN